MGAGTVAAVSSPIRIFINKLRPNLDKVLIGLAAVAMALSGVQLYNQRSYVDCQIQVNDSVVRALDANQEVARVFRDSMNILLAQPPRPAEERRKAFEDLAAALNHQQEVMATIPPVPSEGCR